MLKILFDLIIFVKSSRMGTYINLAPPIVDEQTKRRDRFPTGVFEVNALGLGSPEVASKLDFTDMRAVAYYLESKKSIDDFLDLVFKERYQDAAAFLWSVFGNKDSKAFAEAGLNEVRALSALATYIVNHRDTIESTSSGEYDRTQIRGVLDAMPQPRVHEASGVVTSSLEELAKKTEWIPEDLEDLATILIQNQYVLARGFLDSKRGADATKIYRQSYVLSHLQVYHLVFARLLQNDDGVLLENFYDVLSRLMSNS